MRIIRAIDIPPTWLALCVALAWAQARYLPIGRFGHWADLPGAVLIGAGLGLAGLAAVQFMARRTTIIPRERPSALVHGGLYRFSRNPIYLGDLMILAGLVLRWDAVPSLLLIPALMLLIERRFILGEETGLRAEFGAEFDAWAARVRRWL